jgi:hypothetical protein
MLIDELLPEYDFVERHATHVAAPPQHTYATIGTVDFSANAVVRVLLGLRTLPARIVGGRSSRPPQLTLRSAEQFGFFITAENPPTEIVIALQGKFWTIRGGAECANREVLDLPIPPGTARALWNFSIIPEGDGARSFLATETRVLCADAHAKRLFRIYWFFVRPGSGIIRRVMLRMIRKAAESAE